MMSCVDSEKAREINPRCILMAVLKEQASADGSDKAVMDLIRPLADTPSRTGVSLDGPSLLQVGLYPPLGRVGRQRR